MIEARFLLDSNICIYILDRASSAAVDRLEQCSPGEAVTSSIVFGEVLLGATRKGGVAKAKRFFELLDIFPFDDAAALCYADLPFKRQSFDRLIAAQALSLGVTLITNNERHFAGIEGLKVENWTR